MKILLTGGAGFIGQWTCKRLCDSGYKVDVLDDLSSGRREFVDPRANFIERSVCGPLDDLPSYDVVVHLAAIASVSRCVERLVDSHRVNITGYLNVVEFAKSRPGTRIVYASSAAVYGNSTDVPLSESDPAGPISPYGVDKLSCELHASAAYHVYGVESVGLRFFNVYGEGQDPQSPYSGVLSRFLAAASRGRLYVTGDGKQTRDFVAVHDVAFVIDRLLRVWPSGSSVLNVCTGVETTIGEVADMIAAAHNGRCDIKYVEERLGDIRRSCGENSRLKAVIGPFEFRSLREELASIVTATFEGAA